MMLGGSCLSSSGLSLHTVPEVVHAASAAACSILNCSVCGEYHQTFAHEVTHRGLTRIEGISHRDGETLELEE